MKIYIWIKVSPKPSLNGSNLRWPIDDLMRIFLFKFVTMYGNSYSLIAYWDEWASYQTRNIAGCACAGNTGNVFPRRRLQRKPIVSDPGMHHGVRHARAVMHVGIACLRWREKRSRHSRRMRTRNFPYLARGPWHVSFWFVGLSIVGHWVWGHLTWPDLTPTARGQHDTWISL